jgi:hypothetical protein
VSTVNGVIISASLTEYTLRYNITVNDTISDTISVSPSTGAIGPKSSEVVLIKARVSTTKPNGLYNGTAHGQRVHRTTADNAQIPF